jgi:hypothetical protein
MRRCAQIGPPTLFGWGVLCPCIVLIARWYPGVPVPPLFDWHHIWFLVALLLYAPLAALIDRPHRSGGLIERFASVCCCRQALVCLLFVVGSASFLLTVATEWLVDARPAAAYEAMLSQLPGMAGCLPCYLLGVAVARSAPLAAKVQRSWSSGLAVLALSMAQRRSPRPRWRRPRG